MEVGNLEAATCCWLWLEASSAGPVSPTCVSAGVEEDGCSDCSTCDDEACSGCDDDSCDESPDDVGDAGRNNSAVVDCVGADNELSGIGDDVGDSKEHSSVVEVVGDDVRADEALRSDNVLRGDVVFRGGDVCEENDPSIGQFRKEHTICENCQL